MACQAISLNHKTSFLDRAQSTSSPWQRVIFYRKGDNGQLIKNKKGEAREFIYTLDTRTNELYKGGKYEDDIGVSIAAKCMLIASFNPLFTVGHMAWYLVKTPIQAMKMVVERIKDLGKALKQKASSEELFAKFKTYFLEILNKIKNNLWNVVRAPFFGIAVQFMALYGIVNPYEGRKWEAKIEHEWQHRVSWRQDWRMMDTPESEGMWTALFKDIQKAQCCYLAHCFQVRGKLSDPEFVFVRKA